MPNTPGAKKRMRQSEKRRNRNRTAIKAIKTQLKKVEAAAAAGDMEKLKLEVRTAAMRLDKAASKKIVHPNLAARKKGQLGRLLHKKQAAATAPKPAT